MSKYEKWVGRKVWHQKTGLTGMLERVGEALEMKLDPPITQEEFQKACRLELPEITQEALGKPYIDHSFPHTIHNNMVVGVGVRDEDDIGTEEDRLDAVPHLEYLEFMDRVRAEG
jgi:hypothetical protein